MANTILKESFENNAYFKFLYENVKKQHVISRTTIDELVSKMHIENICVDTVHFLVLNAKDNQDKDMVFYLSYVTNSWIRKPEDYKSYQFPIRIESITVYDNQFEFEMQTKKDLFSTRNIGNVDIPASMMN